MKISTLVLELKTAISALLALALVLCGVYPLVVWGVAQVAFPRQANGSLMHHRGEVVGSSLLGQSFSGIGYFHPRPSAAGAGYDAAGSGGSNLGPLSRRLVEQVQERIHSYRRENGLSSRELVPADAVTASASGLDPHISLQNAALQAGRVARARGLSEELVFRLMRQHIDGPSLGFLGEPGVNVVKVNLVLDERSEGSVLMRTPKEVLP